MALPNIFTKSVSDSVVQRINQLTSATQPQWGKMSVAQMLAHCCVTYEMVYEDKHPKPNAVVKFMLKTFLKNTVVNEKAYKQNSGTGPQFIIKETKDFDAEKTRLIGFINKTQGLSEGHFDGKASHSLGNLNKTEWNNLFYKHLDHHLRQFGV